jgi:phosphocarrier protein
MREATYTILNERGLHARAAARFVHVASRFASRIILECDGEVADGKSILSLMVLGAARGCAVTLRTEGGDEEQAIAELGALIGGGFDESA